MTDTRKTYMCPHCEREDRFVVELVDLYERPGGLPTDRHTQGMVLRCTSSGCAGAIEVFQTTSDDLCLREVPS